jgi:hypothetical protein
MAVKDSFRALRRRPPPALIVFLVVAAGVAAVVLLAGGDDKKPVQAPDDLESPAVKGAQSIPDAAVASVGAGADMVYIRDRTATRRRPISPW